jgi:hypothetical protein
MPLPARDRIAEDARATARIADSAMPADSRLQIIQSLTTIADCRFKRSPIAD